MASTLPVNGSNIYASLEYCSVACNNTPGCLSWGHSQPGDKGATVFYGACNSIIEYDLEAADRRGSTKRVLSGHTDKITSVACSQDNAVLSCSRDRSCKLWKHGCLLAHMKADAALMCGDVTLWKDSVHWVVAGAADDTVQIWKIETGFPPRNLPTLRRGRHSALCVRFHDGPVSDTLLLFVGWTSCELQILELVQESGDVSEYFREVCVLNGHKDWIRGIDVRSALREQQNKNNEKLLVASCGQDSFIRVWRLGPLQKVDDDETEVRKTDLTVNGVYLQAELETVLEGHDGWVYSVRWHPGPELRLLSASIDKSMIVWSPAEEKGCDVWIERLRVGAGGNNLGFMGAVWDPSSGDRILGYGFHGSLHLWTKAGDPERNEWTPCVTPGGHFGPVTGLSWSPRGSYLLSCSTDQTTRLHGKWAKQKATEGTNENYQTMADSRVEVWRELARPQVHGHDLFCISALSETAFVSGAEEKVLRCFNATRNFVTNFRRISGETLTNDSSAVHLPEGASVAALSLFNKGIFEGDIRAQNKNESQNEHPKDDREDFYFRPVELNTPPHEETLAQNTLWHEVRKLYGHGYELFTCAASPDGLLVASACKAQSAKHAAVLLWDTHSWKVVQRLEHHQLTVTCIAFSNDGNRLITVSRDRTWALWEKPSQGIHDGNDYIKVGQVDKTSSIHQRIIWGCAFGPENLQNNDVQGRLFATCSRDKKVVVWKDDRNLRDEARKDGNDGKDDPNSLAKSWKPSLILDVEDSARSLAFSSAVAKINDTTKTFFLAIGLDNGHIDVKRLQFDGVSGELVIADVLTLAAHDLTVNQLCFQPRPCKPPNTIVHTKANEPICLAEILASCSDDYSVKFHRISTVIH
ncbi:putative elongator complex protein 2-like [Tropilaelaps mercedesae]|uniref:Elongator complex protein 2 n=1 Tax=Tropilaelaps mercedesae TaxID=418985 RepID=A0A1V9XSR6_9ACAR|nr:putative elongator complex protein 2-like [Tropilaelaps mercedesae]